MNSNGLIGRVDADEQTALAIYRLSSARKSEIRPPWFSQNSCLFSFIRALSYARRQGLRVRAVLFVDGEVEADLLKRFGDNFDSRVELSKLGNSLSFRNALRYACHQSEDLVLFAEDDYLWKEESIANSISALLIDRRVRYASPYTHPGALPFKRSVLGRRRRPALLRDDWSSISETTMTFAVRRKDLISDSYCWLLATFGKSPKDGFAFKAIIQGKPFLLIANAGFRDLKRIANILTLRLLYRSSLVRIGIKVPMLIQPNSSLATHLHIPYISVSFDWEGFNDQVLASTTD